MIPEFDDRGFLPPGVHKAEWQEFRQRFAITAHRRQLADRMVLLIAHLKSVSCRSLFVDGSYVTDKQRPNDYDACWDVYGVKIEELDPVLTDFTDAGKQRMEDKYGGDIRPDMFSPTETDGTYLDFFQMDRNGRAKGIIHLSLTERST